MMTEQLTTAKDEGEVKRLQKSIFDLCFRVEFLCCLNLMYVFIFLFEFG